MKNNNTPYKITILSDLKDTTDATLKSAISLAKMINGNVDFFHVKRPTEIVESDSQLSAIRTINKEHTNTDKIIKSTLTQIEERYTTKIKYHFSFGNVKNELLNYIRKEEPDIIVLGKRKSKFFGLKDDNITQYILENYEGIIMIASNENTLEPNKELSLGTFNNSSSTLNVSIGNHLMKHTSKAIQSFNIGEDSKLMKNDLVSSKNKNIEYVFEKNDNAIKTLSKYLSKTDVNLLCIDRKNNIPEKKAEIKELFNHTNCSLLLTATENITLH